MNIPIEGAIRGVLFAALLVLLNAPAGPCSSTRLSNGRAEGS